MPPLPFWLSTFCQTTATFLAYSSLYVRISMPCHSTCGRETWPTLRMSNALALFIVCIRVACRSLPLRLLTLLAPRFLLAALTTSLALQQPDRRATPPFPAGNRPLCPKNHTAQSQKYKHTNKQAHGGHMERNEGLTKLRLGHWHQRWNLELGTRNLGWLGLDWPEKCRPSIS